MGSFDNFLKQTMLIERFLGVFCYTLVLLYFFNKIKYAKSHESISKYLNVYLFILCIMAFFYIPGENADLYRWREMAEPWKYNSFSWFWENRVLTTAVPLGYLFVYICQITEIDGLLPMLCALGFFGNLFHIIKCESSKEHRTPDSIAVILLFLMSSGCFLEVISGVRNMLAFSIVLRCVYDEMCENKSLVRSIPFYVIASLLHSAAIPLIGMRFISFMFESKKSRIVLIMNIVAIVVMFIATIRIGMDYIDFANAKYDSYTEVEGYTYGWEYLIGTLSLIVMVLSVLKLKKYYPIEWVKEKDSARFFFIVFVFELINVLTYSIYHRFIIVSMFLSIPVMLTYLNAGYENGYNQSRRFIVVTSLFILFLVCARGNLSGYKFMLLN